ncbi:MAG: LuxR C-terminal-related transcriptional regulator [Solirubrobacterales bacterium]
MTVETSRVRGGALTAPPLVERESQLAAVDAALGESLAGSGLIVIEGEAGTGKTRLLAGAGEMARARGMRTLGATAAELERDYAFGLMRQLLAPALATELSFERDPSAAPALAMLRGAPPAEAPPLDALFAMVHGLYWLCVHLSEQVPTAFVVDDLHWADEPSLRALDYLANRIRGVPAALVVSLRPAEIPAGAGWVRGSLERATVSTGSLSEEGSAELLSHFLGPVPPPFASSAYGATAGNPLLLRELALAFREEGLGAEGGGAERIAALAPASVASWALGRLERCTEDDRRLARTLAVVEAATLPVAAQHAGLGQDDARTAADRLARIGLLDDDLPLRFAHPIVRRALYDGMEPAGREMDHRRAARVLSEAGAAPEQVASHLLASDPRGEAWAVEALRAHAAVAAARGAGAEAARSLRRALAEHGADGPAALHLELGLAELSVNDPAAAEHLSAAAQGAGDPFVTGAACSGLAYARYLNGDPLGSFAATREGLEAIRDAGDGALEAALLVSSLVAGRAHPDLVGEVREQVAGEVPAGGLSAPDVVRSQVRALDAFLGGERDAAAAGARRAADALEDPATMESVPALLTPGPAFVLAGLGRYEEAAPLIERALARAARRGSRLETGQALYDRIWMRWRIGDVDAGLADCDQLFSLAAGAWEAAKAPARVAAACMSIEAGDTVRAAEELELCEALAGPLEGTWGWTWLPYGRAVLALAAGDAAAALAEAELSGERLLALEADSPEYCPWRSAAARAALAGGERRRARDLAQEELEAARATGSGRAVGIALATLGTISDADEGMEALAEAERLLEGAGARLERARALVALGMALRRSRRAREAREPLRAGADLAGALGAAALAGLGVDELRAAGGKPRRARSTGVSALTARERQVAELAAAGLANPQIARRLFIARKTVEAHLRNVFRKLDVSGREQLVKALSGG